MGIVGLIAELLVVSLRISIHSIPKMGVRGWVKYNPKHVEGWLPFLQYEP
jgi:hypothetical protein